MTVYEMFAAAGVLGAICAILVASQYLKRWLKRVYLGQAPGCSGCRLQL